MTMLRGGEGGHFRRCVHPLVALCLLTLFSIAARAESPEFVALKISHPIKLTGRLDDPAWRKAQSVTRCFEAYPNALAPCPYPTVMRVLYNDRYLYVGIEADDPRPGLIRDHFVRRDELYSPVSDDHLQLYLDALDTGNSAQIFALSPRNNQLDGFWSEATQSEDYTANFDWASATARTANGWTAVFRIPFTSLRYRPGHKQVWKLVLWRGIVRDDFYQEASTKIPSGANCLLCYAGNLVLDDFPISVTGHTFSITPELTFTHNTESGDYDNASYNHLNVGGYLKWQPRIGTVVDGMWNPDFSQVESDDFQATANNQFALFYPEKRPFFLESKNLLNSPLNAIYTRTIAEPRWGARLTQQTGGGAFTVLATRDRGGGDLIEPGVLSSTLVPQPGSSLATLGRAEEFAGNWRIGGLFTYRRYSDGSYNLVAGPDTMWTPTDADRVRAQYLFSATRDPDRPDLYADWRGQSLRAGAVYLDWSHGTGTWAWEDTWQYLGEGFRAWEGYVPQVGIRQFEGKLGYYFYPSAHWLDNIEPELQYTRSVDTHGNLVLSAFAPTLIVNATHSSTLEITWHPDDRQLSAAGLQHLRYATLAFAALPGAHLTHVKTSLRVGDDVDYLTGKKAHGVEATATLQIFPLARLELDLTAAWQHLKAEVPLSTDNWLFDERGLQLRTFWYFARGLYIELSGERDRVDRNPNNYAIPVNASDTTSLFTLMFAWEPSPLTHFYVGYHKSMARTTGAMTFAGDQTEFFVKAAYKFPI